MSKQLNKIEKRYFRIIITVQLFLLASCGQSSRTQIDHSRNSRQQAKDRYLYLLGEKQPLTLADMPSPKQKIANLPVWTIAGDILVTESDFKTANEAFYSQSAASRLRVANQSGRESNWPNARIPYFFGDHVFGDGTDAPPFRPEERQFIRSVFREYGLETGLTFEETFPTDADLQEVVIQNGELFLPRIGESLLVLPSRAGACGAATLGYKPGRVNFLDINFDCNSSFFQGVLKHEIGHTLGIFHTQNSFDRDQYVTFNRAAIQDTALDVDLNFGTQFHISATVSGFYDFSSIMHYASFTGVVSCTFPYCSPVLTRNILNPLGSDNGWIGPFEGYSYLTQADVNSIRMLYGLEEESPCNRLQTNTKGIESCTPPPLPDLVVPEVCAFRDPAEPNLVRLNPVFGNEGQTRQRRNADFVYIGYITRDSEGRILERKNLRCLGGECGFSGMYPGETLDVGQALNNSYPFKIDLSSSSIAEIEIVADPTSALSEINELNNGRKIRVADLSTNEVFCSNRVTCIQLEGVEFSGLAIDCNSFEEKQGDPSLNFTTF